MRPCVPRRITDGLSAAGTHAAASMHSHHTLWHMRRHICFARSSDCDGTCAHTQRRDRVFAVSRQAAAPLSANATVMCVMRRCARQVCVRCPGCGSTASLFGGRQAACSPTCVCERPAMHAHRRCELPSSVARTSTRGTSAPPQGHTVCGWQARRAPRQRRRFRGGGTEHLAR